MGATVPTVYYGFCDDPELQLLYWSVVSGLALFCGIATAHPTFRRPSFRPYRTLMFASLGLSAVVFISHGIIFHGWEAQKQRISLDYMILMACLNLVGGGIYAARVGTTRTRMLTTHTRQIPEKWCPTHLTFAEQATKFLTSWL